MEKEIEKELWKGNIAVVIKLHKDDVTSLEEIHPLLVRFCFNFEIELSACILRHTHTHTHTYRYQHHVMDFLRA